MNKNLRFQLTPAALNLLVDLTAGIARLQNLQRCALTPGGDDERPPATALRRRTTITITTIQKSHIAPPIQSHSPNMVHLQCSPQMRALRRRKALPITDTELKLMAAAAIIGESNRPNTG
jgi:hypothetical protein